MKRLIATVATSLALGGAVAGLPAVVRTPIAVAKTCSGSYVHAVIGGAEKCLRRGEFCARGYESQYRRYGFTCRPDGSGYNRLS